MEAVGCPHSVPWAFVEPHAEQAVENHDQTLERLAARGGLSPSEMVAVIRGLGLRAVYELGDGEGARRLVAMLRDWEAERRSDSPQLRVGQMLYGYCGGFFGRDSYDTKRIEAVGTDWVVAREVDSGQVVFAQARKGLKIDDELAEYTRKARELEDS